jgi:hypothetical protein
MPQFGSSTVRAFLPNTSLFSNVAGGSLTSYTNITAPHWFIFTASYGRNVTALSFPFMVADGQFYSLFTYQTLGNQLLNKLVPDTCQSANASVALLRTINLVQYNFPVNVYNFSNNAELFDQIEYGDASPYKAFLPGDYMVYWTSAAVSKRGIQGSNISGDPFLYGGKSYTYWIFPTGSFIVEDCGSSTPVKRDVNNQNQNVNGDVNINQQVSISKLRMRRAVNRSNTAVQQVQKEAVLQKENGKDDNLSPKNDKSTLKSQDVK